MSLKKLPLQECHKNLSFNSDSTSLYTIFNYSPNITTHSVLCTEKWGNFTDIEFKWPLKLIDFSSNWAGFVCAC